MENEIIQWHPPFCSAMHLEFIDDKDILEYFNEYNLGKKPIQIDLLVIKKAKDVTLKNEIGKIFKGHNIMEYKSPGDDMNVDTYYKALAYASFYKANGEHVDEIKADDITISLVREEKPVELMKWLESNGYTITDVSRGIYYVYKDGFFDTQIIVSKELSQEEHLWVVSLTRNIQRETAKRLAIQTRSFSGKSEREYADSVLSVAIEANKKEFGILKKEENDMNEALTKFFETEINEKVEEKIKAEIKAKDAEIQAKDAEIQKLKEMLKAASKKPAMF